MDDELEDEIRADPLLKKIAERDLRLAELSVLMSKTMAAQRMLREAKLEGLDIPEMDNWLLMLQAGSNRIVELMNERMQKLPPLDRDLP